MKKIIILRLAAGLFIFLALYQIIAATNKIYELIDPLINMEKKNLVLFIIGCIIVILIGYFFVKAALGGSNKESTASQLVTIPDPQENSLPDRKIDAYKNAKGRLTYSDLAGDFDLKEPIKEQSSSQADEICSTVQELERVAQQSTIQSRPSPRQKIQIDSSLIPSKQNWKEKYDYVYQLATGGSPSETSPSKVASKTTSEKVIFNKPIEEQHNIVESLGTSSGFITAVGNKASSPTRNSSPVFKVSLLVDQTITTGKRVVLRLLEDLVIGHIRLEKNSHLIAMASISERIYLEIKSCEYKGQTFSLNFTAYDVDGQRGLYCPESTPASTRKDVTNDILSVGSSLGSSLSRGASQVISTAGRLITKNNNETSVSISNTYEFYISSNE